MSPETSAGGLGVLKVWRKEREQPRGGRVDFVLEDTDTGVRYETEVMLGATDENQIIRTLEYWDKESRRYLDRITGQSLWPKR